MKWLKPRTLMDGKQMRLAPVDENTLFEAQVILDEVRVKGDEGVRSYVEKFEGRKRDTFLLGRKQLHQYLKEPERYQLLCANCNHAKRMNGGKLYLRCA